MSDRDLHEQVSALFLRARDTPADEREQFLRHAAGEDERLLNEVRTLLDHDLTVDADGIRTSRHQGLHAQATSSLTPRPFNASPASIPPLSAPARIGPYRVIERIGRGGSGYVLLAEQEQPIRRRVAIKIVPHAAIDPAFAARFEVERHALERTDHPNIARILDAGRTADGLPYLVMEYVQGAPITEHCRRNGVSLRDRIGLMLDVADAVQHAHQRGVIHRDIKPANILVSQPHSEEPLPAPPDNHPDARRTVARPKLVDFGIAKSVADAAGFSIQSPPTMGQLLGTPAYMAPEQTGSGGAPVDTRADVYALGAVLYQLACGRTPIDVAAAGGSEIGAVERIRQTIPAPASRVRAQNARTGMFAGDHVPRSLLSDLDCVLARALEKSPDRRYPTASAFADDLQRLLRREPIVATPPTWRYRTTRFAQRNRVLVASVAVVLVAMITGIAGLASGLVEARRQRREAFNQSEAQREINRFLTDDLLAAASPEEEGQNITASDLLHRAGARVEQRFVGRPLIAASIHHTLGGAYSTLGSFDDADRHLQRAIELRRGASGANAPDTVRSEIAAASLLARRQRMEEADAALTRVIQRARLILASNDPALLTALNDLGSLRETEDRPDEAISLLQEALSGRIQTLGPRDPQVLMTMSNLAMAYERKGDTERALQMQIDALRVADAIEPQPRMTLIGLNNNVGATYQDLNRDEEAEPYLERAEELAREWLGEEHPDALTIRANLAGLKAELGDPAGAMKLLDEVIAVRTRTLGPTAWDTLTARYAYWNAMHKATRFGEAADGYIAFLPEASAGLGDQHWFAAQTRAALALALLHADRLDEALPHAERAVAQLTTLYSLEHARTKNAAVTLQTIRTRLARESAAAPSAATTHDTKNRPPE